MADLKKAYRTIMDDHFPPRMEVAFGEGTDRQVLVYEKVSWIVEGVEKGLRYGENPGQEAALYRLVNGNLILGEARTIAPGRYLAGWLPTDASRLRLLVLRRGLSGGHGRGAPADRGPQVRGAPALCALVARQVRGPCPAPRGGPACGIAGPGVVCELRDGPLG